MQGKKISMKGTSTGTVALNDEVFATKAHPQTINDVVKAQLNNQRQGTNSTKTRAEVAGGGRKPWRQKGTGRARAGSTTSPLWPGGGCTFGPHQQVYDIRPPKQMVDRAITGVLAELAAHDHVVVVDGLGFDSGKTRDVRTFLAGLKIEKALLVVPEITENSRRAVANMREVKIVTPTQVNVVDLLKFGHLAIHDQAVKLLEEVLSK